MKATLICLSVAALVFVGCAEEPRTGTQTDPAVPSSDPAAVLEAAIRESLQAGSVRMEFAFEMGDGNQAFEFGGEAEVAFDPPAQHMTMEFPSLGEGVSGGEMEMILDGTMMYIRSPLFAAATGARTLWVKMDLTELGSEYADLTAFGSGSSDPTQALDLLMGAVDVTEAGDEILDGRLARRYAVSVDLAEVAQELSGEVPAAARASIEDLRKQLGGAKLPVDVWIADGYVVRERVDLAGFAGLAGPTGSGGSQGPSMTMTVDLSGYGEEVDISLPPSNQVTDVTELAQAGL